MLQECVRRLNVANLLDREKGDILDMPIVLEGIFGSIFGCEAKKKENEAQLCLPQKTSDSPQSPQRKAFTRAATQVPQFRTGLLNIWRCC